MTEGPYGYSHVLVLLGHMLIDSMLVKFEVELRNTVITGLSTPMALYANASTFQILPAQSATLN